MGMELIFGWMVKDTKVSGSMVSSTVKVSMFQWRVTVDEAFGIRVSVRDGFLKFNEILII